MTYFHVKLPLLLPKTVSVCICASMSSAKLVITFVFFNIFHEIFRINRKLNLCLMFQSGSHETFCSQILKVMGRRTTWRPYIYRHTSLANFDDIFRRTSGFRIGHHKFRVWCVFAELNFLSCLLARKWARPPRAYLWVLTKPNKNVGPLDGHSGPTVISVLSFWNF